jgi:hypothetical protein
MQEIVLEAEFPPLLEQPRRGNAATVPADHHPFAQRSPAIATAILLPIPVAAPMTSADLRIFIRLIYDRDRL